MCAHTDLGEQFSVWIWIILALALLLVPLLLGLAFLAPLLRLLFGLLLRLFLGAPSLALNLLDLRLAQPLQVLEERPSGISTTFSPYLRVVLQTLSYH